MPVAEPPGGGETPVAEPRRTRLNARAVAIEALRLTRLPAPELDQLIVDRIDASFTFARFAGMSVMKLRLFNPFRIFKEYRKIKNAILAAPGRGTGLLIRWGSRDGGRGFCVRIRYCKRKAKIKEQMEDIGEFFDDATALNEVLADRAPDVLEVSVELAQEIGDWVGDLLLVPLLAKILLYGLDDICPCCKRCDGGGKTKAGKDCHYCDGTGQAKRKP